MLLKEIQVRAILAATKSGELKTRAWLLDSCTVTNGFDVKIEVDGEPKLGETIEDHSGNLTDVRPGTVIGVGDKLAGIVLNNDSGVASVAVLGDGKTPIFHRDDVIAYDPALFKEYLGDRKRQIEDIASTMYSTVIKNAPSTESVADVSAYRKQVVSGYMVDFEKELGRSKYVIACATSSNQSKTLNEIRNKFTPNWRHCLDYWVKPGIADAESPTELDVAIMTATLFVDAGVTNSAAKAMVIDAVEKAADALGKNYEFIRQSVDNSLGNIVLKQEGVLTNVA